MLTNSTELKDSRNSIIMGSGVFCKCGLKINPMHNYCTNCSAKLRNVCKECKNVDSLESKYCHVCGEQF